MPEINDYSAAGLASRLPTNTSSIPTANEHLDLTHLPSTVTSDIPFSKYDKGLLPGQNVDMYRGENQPILDKWANGLVAGAGSVAGQMIEGIGFLGGAPENVYNLVKGANMNFSNWMSEAGQKLMETSKDAFPVYMSQTAKSGDFFNRLSSASYWASNIGNIASTLSFLIPTTLAVKGLSYTAKLARLEQLTGELGFTTKLALKGVSGAVISRQMESMMEGKSTYDLEYQKALDMGRSKADATSIASKAAAFVYKANWLNLMQDIPENMLLFGAGRGITGAIEGFGSKALKVAALEGTEEGAQYVMQKEGERIGDDLLGIKDTRDFGTRLWDYMDDPEFADSVFLGALGGTMATGYQALKDRNINKTNRNKQSEVNTTITGAKTNKKGGEIVEDKAFHNLAVDAALAGNFDAVEEMLNDVEQDHKAWGFGDTVTNKLTDEEVPIKQVIQKKKADLKSFKDKWVELKNRFGEGDVRFAKLMENHISRTLIENHLTDINTKLNKLQLENSALALAKDKDASILNIKNIQLKLQGLTAEYHELTAKSKSISAKIDEIAVSNPTTTARKKVNEALVSQYGETYEEAEKRVAELYTTINNLTADLEKTVEDHKVLNPKATNKSIFEATNNLYNNESLISQLEARKEEFSKRSDAINARQNFDETLEGKKALEEEAKKAHEQKIKEAQSEAVAAAAKKAEEAEAALKAKVNPNPVVTPEPAKTEEEVKPEGEFEVGDEVKVLTKKDGESVVQELRGDKVLLEDGRQVATKNLEIITQAEKNAAKVEQIKQEALSKSATPVVNEIEAKKADIENQIKELENVVNSKEFATSDILKKHWQTRKDLLTNKIKQLRQLLSSGIKTGEDVFKATILLNDIRGTLNEGIDLNNIEYLKSLELKFRELASNIQSTFSENLIQEYVDYMNNKIKSRGMSIEKDLAKYSGLNAYTLDGKNEEYFLTSINNSKNNLSEQKADIERRKSILLKKANLSKAPGFAQKAIVKTVESIDENIRLQVIEKAYEGITATPISKELGLTTEQVRSIRTYYGVPDIADKTDYQIWKKNIDAELATLDKSQPEKIYSEAEKALRDLVKEILPNKNISELPGNMDDLPKIMKIFGMIAEEKIQELGKDEGEKFMADFIPLITYINTIIGKEATEAMYKKFLAAFNFYNDTTLSIDYDKIFLTNTDNKILKANTVTNNPLKDGEFYGVDTGRKEFEVTDLINAMNWTSTRGKVMADGLVISIDDLLIHASTAISGKSKDFKTEKTTGEGETFVRNVQTSNVIRKDMLNPHVLVPGKYEPGTKVILSVDTSYSDPETGVSYNSLKERETTSKRPNELVPIKITDETGKIIGYLHDLDYIRDTRVVATIDNFDNIAFQKERLRTIRHRIISEHNNGNTVKTTIVAKSIGKLNTEINNKRGLVSKFMVDPDLHLAVAKSNMLMLDLDSSFANSKRTVLNTDYTDGAMYAIVKVPGNSYIALLLDTVKISKEYADSMYKVLEAALSQNNETSIKIQQDILKETKGTIDIFTNKGLKEYFNKFVYTADIERIVLKEEGKQHKKYLDISPGATTRIAFAEGGGAIREIRTLQDLYNKKDKLYETLLGMYMSFKLKEFNTSKEFSYPLVNLEGKVTSKKSTYKAFIKEHTTTNIVGNEVANEDGTTSYVYTNNPVMQLNASDLLAEAALKEVAKGVPVITPETRKESSETKTTAFKLNKDYNPDDELPLGNLLHIWNKTKGTFLSYSQKEADEEYATLQLIFGKNYVSEPFFTGKRHLTTGQPIWSIHVKKPTQGTDFDALEDAELVTPYEAWLRTLTDEERELELIDRERRINESELPIGDEDPFFSDKELKARGLKVVKSTEQPINKEIKPNEIYSKLGNKTKSENVVIKSWGELKDATRAITSEGIISTRIKNANYDFGNIYSDRFGGNLIKVDSIKEAVERYINWIITGETGEYVFTGIQPEELEEKRDWILEKLQSGELKDKPILYYKELGEPSHATALDYLINKYDWNINQPTEIKPDEFTNHSGGAIGADSMFDKIGRELGFNNHNHYWANSKTPLGNKELTKEQLAEGVIHAKAAAKELGRPWIDKYANLLGRNWFQVKNSTQIIAIAPIVHPNETNSKGYKVKALRDTVDGGTGYAVEMGIANGKEVNVFNTKDNQWYKWNGTTFEKSEIPTLHKDFAGIGSRQDNGKMTPESIQAIKDVYEKTLNQSTEIKTQEQLINKEFTPEELKPISEAAAAYKIQGLGLARTNQVRTFMVDSVIKSISNYKDKKEIAKAKKDVYDSILKQFSGTDEPIFNLIVENFAKLIQLADAKLKKYELESKYSDDSDEGLRVRTSFDSEASLKEDVKDYISPDLRRFFSFIPSEKQYFFNLPNGDKHFIPMDFNTVFNTLQARLADLPADYNKMMEVLNNLSTTMKAKAKNDKKTYLDHVIERLNNSTEEIRNEFTKVMYKHYVNMKFVRLAIGVVKAYDRDTQRLTALKNAENQLMFDASMQIIDSNRNSVQRVILKEWFNNQLKDTKLLHIDQEGKATLLPSKKQELIAEYEALITNINDEGVLSWLNKLGIDISELTLNVLKERSVEVYKMFYDDLFTNKGGLFHELYVKLKGIESDTDYSDDNFLGNNPLNDNTVKKLALLEAEDKERWLSNAHKDSAKNTIYSYTNNKLLFDILREIKDPETGVNYLKSRMKNNFNGTSDWAVELMKEDSKFRTVFQLWYPDAITIKGSTRKGKKLIEQSKTEHEAFKVTLFQNQGGRPDSAGRRTVNFLTPTMSDKSNTLALQALAHETLVTYKEDGTLDKLGESTIDLLFDKVIGEYKRIRDFQRNPSDTAKRTAAYKEGAQLFLLFPELNTLSGLWNDGKIKDNLLEEELNEQGVPTNTIYEAMRSVVTARLIRMIKDKQKEWLKLGIVKITTAENTSTKTPFSVIEFPLFDRSYVKSVRNTRIKTSGTYATKNQAIFTFAAADFVINNLNANANIFQIFLGDPALYFKKGKGNTLKNNIKETYINIGKRLAMFIAPGDGIPNSRNNRYTFITIDDIKSISSNIEQIKILLKNAGMDTADEYMKIDAADAQEYTTVAEHLYLLHKLGRISQTDVDRIMKTIYKEEKDLSPEDLLRVMQPMKPVVSGLIDTNEDLSYLIYVKTSSFPLLPQLTRGLELDELRKAMESQGVDRVAFKSGVKLGARLTTEGKVFSIFNKEGKMLKSEEIDFTDVKQILSRENFRIQQDIPYDASKHKINDGTQQRKLLFANFLDIEGFKYQGKSYKGNTLKDIFMDTYEEIYKLSNKELLEEFTSHGTTDIKKIAKKLQEEAITRGYSVNDVKALEIVNNYFRFPLWSTGASDKLESLLNSIVDNKVRKQKMNGLSYVLGSEEGFKAYEDLKKKELIGIVHLKSFDPKTGLKPQRYVFKDGTEIPKSGKGKFDLSRIDEYKVAPAQVFAPFKLRDSEGKLLNIKDFIVTEDGQDYIDTDKIPEEALQYFGFRIPTQGHNSMSLIQIVGFLPESSGDLLIASRDWTKQMGSDFDIDKLYTYSYNFTYAEGKFTKIQNDEFEGLQNKLLDIHFSVLSNTDTRVQTAIINPLTNGKLDELAEKIDGFKEERRRLEDPTNLQDSILSDSYQRTKFINATAGKAGVGVKSLDSIFAASAQGLNIYLANRKNEPITFTFNGQTYSSLSEVYTNSGTYKLSVIAAYQSASVDNEKLQILDKINSNSITFDAERTLSLLGFDETTIAAFTSQDVVFDYVDKIKALRDSTSHIYTPEPEALVYKELMDEYAAKSGMTAASIAEYMLTNKVDENTFNLTTAQMMDMIEFGKDAKNIPHPYAVMQAIVLSKYTKATEVGKSIQDIQSALNTDGSSGLGLNIIETTFKEEQIKNIPTNPYVRNAVNLIGSVQVTAGGKLLVTPKTISGFAIQHALLTNNELWKKYYPFETAIVKDIFEEIENFQQEESTSTKIRSTSRKDIWNGMKSFLYSGENSGLYDDMLSNERSRLFIDVPLFENLDLAFDIDKMFNKEDYISDKTKLSKANKFIGYEEGNEKTAEYYRILKQKNKANLETYNVHDVVYVAGGQEKRGRKLPRLDLVQLAMNAGATIITDNPADRSKPINIGEREVAEYLSANGYKETLPGVWNSTTIEIPEIQKSLALRIEEFKKTKKGKNNIFIRLLTTDLRINGSISLVKFNAATGEAFDEDDVHIAFLDLLDNPETAELAKDLIRASYLSGGIQEAIQYVKYIPLDYLQSIGFTNYLNKLNFRSLETFNTQELRIGAHLLSRYTRQYFQHNPNEAPSITSEQFTQVENSRYDVIGIKPEFLSNYMVKVRNNKDINEAPAPFISLHASGTAKGYQLFQYLQYDTETKTEQYVRIDTLGTFGLDEYSKDDEHQLSIITGNRSSYLGDQSITHYPKIVTKTEQPNPLPERLKVRPVEEIYHLNDGRLTPRTLQAIIDSSTNKGFVQIAQIFLDNFNKVSDVKLIVDNTLTSRGRFNNEERLITIRTNAPGYSDATSIEESILHEITHAFLNKILRANPKDRTESEEAIVKSLNIMYKKLIEQVRANPTLSAALDKIIEGDRSGALEITTYPGFMSAYAASDIVEFVALALSNPNLQALMKTIPFTDKKSMWDRFLEIIGNLLKAFGIKNNTLASAAISDIVALINNKETKEEAQTPKDYVPRQILLPNGKTITTNKEQTNALNMLDAFGASDELFFTLSGYAGTGKSTIVKQFIDDYKADKEKKYRRVAVSAPTHKAKKVVSRTTKLPGLTIQAILGLRPNTDLDNFKISNPQFDVKAEAKIGDYNLIVIDESSMLNGDLFDLIIKKAREAGTKIVFMGDSAQLPPVKERIAKVFNSPEIQKTAHLTKVERTADSNPLMFIYDAIRNNLDSLDPFIHRTALTSTGDGIEFTDSVDAMLDKAVQLFTDQEFTKNGNYVKLITWTNDSVANWNSKIRENIHGKDVPQLIVGEPIFGYKTLSDFDNIIIENGADYKVAELRRGVNTYGFNGYFIKLTDVDDSSTTQELFVLDHTDEVSVKNFLNKHNTLLTAAKTATIGKARGKAWAAYYDFKKSTLLMSTIQIDGDAIAKDIDYGYAITGHKSQGSGYQNVLISENNIDLNSDIIERNKLKYVAFSRATNYVMSYSKKTVKDNNISELPMGVAAVKVTHKTDILNKLQETLIRVRNNMATYKDDPKRVDALKQRAKVLTDQIYTLSKYPERLDYIIETGKESMIEAERIFAQDTINESDFLYLNNILTTWDKAVNTLFDEDDLEKFEGEFTANVKAIQAIQEDAQAKMIIWLGMSKQFLNAKSTKEFNFEQDLFAPMKEINTVTANMMDISRSGNAALSLIDSYLRTATYNTKAEQEKKFELIEEGIKELKDHPLFKKHGMNLFLQTEIDASGKEVRTGNLVSYHNRKYWDTLLGLREKAANAETDEERKKAWTQFFAWKNANTITLDYRILFFKEYRDLGNNIREYSDEDITNYEQQLINYFGKAKFEALKEKARLRLDKYIEDREHRYASIDDIIKDPEQNRLAKNEWEHEYSPFNYAENKNSKVRLKGKTGRDIHFKGYDYVLEQPRKYDSQGQDLNWYDPKFKTIENDPVLSKFYTLAIETLQEMKGYLPSYYTEHMNSNSLPNIAKSVFEIYSEEGFGAGVNGWWDNFIESIRNTETNQDFSIKDAEGRKEKSIPILYIPSKEADQRFIEAQTKSYDLEKVLKAFSMMSLAYKHKAKIEDIVRLGQLLVNQSLEQQYNAKGEAKLDRYSNLWVIKNSLDNIKSQLQYAIDAGLYGERKEKEGQLTKKVLTTDEKKAVKKLEEQIKSYKADVDAGTITEEEYLQKKVELENEIDNIGKGILLSGVGDKILQYVQLKGMGWNVFSSITNVTFGWISNIIHAAGGEDFNMKQFLKANRMMLATTGKSISLDTIRTPLTKKIGALMRKFDVVKELNEANYASSTNNNELTNAAKMLLPYEWQRRGEYFVQGQVMISMMLNVEITNLKGEKLSLFDAYDDNGNWNTAEFGEQPEWANEYNENQGRKRRDFKFRMDQVIKSAHGNYDPQSATKIKKYFAGRALVQFRSWVTEGVANRFESEGYDKLLGRIRKGRYRTLGEFYGKKDRGFMLATVDLLKALVSKAGKEGLSDVDKANMRKNLAELIIYISLSAIGMMLKGFKDDDDDADDKAKLTFSMNVAYRLQKDIMFFVSPTAFKDITRNTVPLTQLITDSGEWLVAAGKYMNGNDILKTGPYAKESRLLRETAQMLPLGTQIYRLRGASTFEQD